jgi:hypothetical protein
MFILYLPVLAFVGAVVLGGRAGRLADVRLRWLPALVGAMLVQGPLFGPLAGLLAPGDPVATGLYIASSLVALGVVVANRAQPGLGLLAGGAALNLVAIVANGGVMPASPEALAALGWQTRETFSNSALLAEPALAPLTDVFALPGWLPFANVYSFGDVLIALGVSWFIVRTMAPSAPRPGGSVAG